ncbi:MAG: response regulator transcription factor [Burkholderiales bacterium]
MNEQDAVIFVVDDDAAMRRSLAYLFDSVGWRVELFDSGRDFLDRYDGHLPGCLVLDMRMPLMSGLELQHMLKEREIGIPIVFLTGHGDVAMAVQAMKTGASDFLEKPCKDQVLLDTVSRAVQRSLAVCRKSEQTHAVLSILATLTPREREVAERVALGKANKIIARELDISDKTVQVHRHHAMEKMGVHSAAELALVLFGAEADDAS